jgi:thiol-disulfide isomerase/thioredoxin
MRGGPPALQVGVTAGVIVAIVTVAGAALAGVAWKLRDGKPRRGHPGRLTATELGQPLGQRGTLVQFSSAFCAPCRAARQILAELATASGGITHVEIDVADRMDLVRLLSVRRTPTVLVLDSEGRVARRASGLPRRRELAEVLAGQIGSDSDHGRA